MKRFELPPVTSLAPPAELNGDFSKKSESSLNAKKRERLPNIISIYRGTQAK